MPRQSPSSWSKKYPPLAGVAAMLFIAVAVLPSALTLPQTNPSTTLEYAPVPPQDQGVAPPGGNLSSLGLATTSGLTRGAVAPLPVQGAGPASAGKNPSTKKCVGNPPRQTEDPLSPPCVAHFEGNNFGSTYNGVTGAEVRIVAYVFGRVSRPTGEGWEVAPSGRCFDLGVQPTGDEDVYHRILRAMQHYFNERYQTYGRLVRVHLCYDDGNDTPQGRRAEAAKHVKDLDPFAVVNLLTTGNTGIYTETVATRGRAVFTALLTQLESDMRRHPGLLWNYLPSIEQKAANFADYVCTKVVKHAVSFAGNDQDADTRLHNGRPRRLGLLSTDDPGSPNLVALARIVKQRIEACGGTFVAQATYPTWGCYYGSCNPGKAAPNIALFKQEGVTTVIWPGGVEADHTKAAAGVNYRPEWVFAGDEQQEGYDVGQFQEKTVWQHAWIVTNQTRLPSFEEDLCWQAMQEADPNAYAQDAKYACNIGHIYESFRQLFTGIQVAGPRLTPAKIDQGFHAIPGHPSSNPRVPACFYLSGDYSCVKDATPMWWDPAGTARNGTAGCWRMPQEGKRFLTGAWPPGDVIAQKGTAATDPCNAYSASIYGA